MLELPTAVIIKEEEDGSKSRKSVELLFNLSRYLGLSFILLALWKIAPLGEEVVLLQQQQQQHTSSSAADGSPGVNILSSIWQTECDPGSFRTPSQLSHTYWSLPNNNNNDGDAVRVLPLYTTNSLDVFDARITRVVLVQHGNLRNGNDYFCGAVNSVRGADLDDDEMSSIMIVAPQFLIDDDLCWHKDTHQALNVRASEGNVCGYPLPIYTTEGWKDGHLSQEQPTSSAGGTSSRLFSYEVFNRLIERLGDKNFFPNVRSITLFGFSAGAQTLLRYSILPLYKFPASSSSSSTSSSPDANVNVRFVISDPSTFVYLNNERPAPSSESGSWSGNFAVPDSSWVTSWPWIWENDGYNSNCAGYNNWRFGLEALTGYLEHHQASSAAVRSQMISSFPSKAITYLVGDQDTRNCKLFPSNDCADYELATYCQAMLQGNNRYDRAIKWKAYLRHFYGRDVHDIYFAGGIDHDPKAMIRSSIGRCVIFNVC